MVATWECRLTDERVTDSHILPYVDSETAPPEVAAALNTLPFQRNVFKLLANSPATFPPFMKLLSSCWSPDMHIRASEWQLVVLRTASLLNAPYEWDVNEPVGRVVRYDTEEKLAAIRSGDLSGPTFTDRHRLIGKMVEQLVHHNAVEKATMLEARRVLGAGVTEEVLMIHGIYGLLARLMNSCEIDFDPPIEGLDGTLRKYNATIIEKERALEMQD